MSIFVLQLRFVPEENDRRLEARPRHREYLRTLYDQGRLVDAGPFEDGEGALLLYQAESEAEIHEILAYDPYPADAYEIALLREWKPLFERLATT